MLLFHQPGGFWLVGICINRYQVNTRQQHFSVDAYLVNTCDKLRFVVLYYPACKIAYYNIYLAIFSGIYF